MNLFPYMYAMKRYTKEKRKMARMGVRGGGKKKGVNRNTAYPFLKQTIKMS